MLVSRTRSPGNGRGELAREAARAARGQARRSAGPVGGLHAPAGDGDEAAGGAADPHLPPEVGADRDGVRDVVAAAARPGRARSGRRGCGPRARRAARSPRRSASALCSTRSSARSEQPVLTHEASRVGPVADAPQPQREDARASGRRPRSPGEQDRAAVAVRHTARRGTPGRRRAARARPSSASPRAAGPTSSLTAGRSGPRGRRCPAPSRWRRACGCPASSEPAARSPERSASHAQ